MIRSKTWLLLWLCLGLGAAPAQAEEITLAWNANTEPDVAEYKLYYGTAPGQYTTSISVGEQTSHTVTGLLAGTYYFAVTAISTDGLESDFSNEVSQTVGPPFVTDLFYPRLVSSRGGSAPGPSAIDASENMGLAVVNLNSVDSTLRFSAFGESGDLFQGAGVRNPESRLLEQDKQVPLLDSEVFGIGLPSLNPVGWLRLESTADKIVGFFLIFNDHLDFLDGADASAATLTSFVFPEIEGDGFTQLHVANPGTAPAAVTFERVDPEGALLATADRTIEASGVLAEDLATLFPGSGVADYIRVTADRGVAAFQYLGKTLQFVHGLNGQDAGAGAATLYSPQYVVGGGNFRTTLSVINLGASAASVTFRFIRDDGAQIGSTVIRSIEAGGKLYISEQDFFFAPLPTPQTQTQGYVEIRSDGPKLTGSVVFGDPDRGSFSSALPLISDLQASLVFGQVASNNVYFMGIALLNPNGAQTSATIEVFDKDGNLLRTRTLGIGALRRISMLLTQYFPDLAGVDLSSGYIRVTVDQGIAGFALFGTHDLSVLSAVPPQVLP